MPLEPHGKGFVVIDGRIESGGMKDVAPGVCPKCETKAAPWTPPTDPHALNRIAALKETHGLATDAEARAAYLAQQGGFIHGCIECATSYWVPAAAATIAEDK